MAAPEWTTARRPRLSRWDSALQALLAFLHPERALAAADRAAIETARRAANAQRVAIFAPFLLLMHVASLVAFTLFPPATAGEARWRHGLQILHGTGVVVAVLFVLAVRGNGRRAPAPVHRHLGEVMLCWAVTLGTASMLNSTHVELTLTPWIIALMLGAVAMHNPVGVSAACHLVALGGAIVATATLAGPSSERLGLTINAVTLGVLAFVLSRSTYAGFVGGAMARRRFEQVRDELEDRVDAQVGEIVARSKQIAALNRQLSGEVQKRSLELSTALRRLAAMEHGEEVLRSGARLGERFEIRYLLGVGGMGVVYAAHDHVGRVDVAIKVVHGSLAGVEHAYRFLQEATAAASLAHPAIVRVLHVDVTSDGHLYQVLELIDGQPLDAWTNYDRRLPPAQVAQLGATLADALATAHAQGVVHRDIKPQNVMLTADPPGCRLLDFGLAKLRRATIDASLTEHGNFLGTPQFVAPEQITAPESASGPADVYGLGLVLYASLLGHLPYSARTAVQWLAAHTDQAPAPVPAGAAPPVLADLLMACLAKTPAARPSAREVQAVLAELALELGGEPLHEWVAHQDRGDTRPRPVRRGADEKTTLY